MKQPNFKYLGSRGFPHSDNVDVYKYENEIDYSRYNYDQMKLTICAVPWDMGEAHIGNRTIDGVGNVVYFDSKDKRDEWFASIPDNECFRWETKFKELHSDNSVLVPLPFDIVSRFNYLFVEYSLFANDNSLLEYESKNGVRKWCYFIRNVEFVAPNTSRLELMADNWQTFIYDFNLTGMILERGHAPMFKTKTDKFLENPLENNEDLLCEDVNFGELQKITHTSTTPLNSKNMKACIATNANIIFSWSDQVPTATLNLSSGVPTTQIFCCNVGDLYNVITKLDTDRPQFKQTIKAIFFISSDFLTIGQSFKIGDYDCNVVSSNTNQINKSLYNFNKNDWSYDSKYKDIAKLYTFPYSAIEVTDENGKTTLIKIEDTNSKLSIDVVANLVYPTLNLQSVIKGVGGNESISIKFNNVTEKTFTSSGRWYEYINEWKIPTFSVYLDSYSEYMYSTRFIQKQRKLDAETAKTIAERNADTSKIISNRSAQTGYENQIKDATTNKDNTKRSNDTTKTNSDLQATTVYSNTVNINDATKTCEFRGADNVINNATAQTTANDTNCTKSNEASTSDCNLSNSLQVAMQAWDAGYTDATTNEQIQADQQTAAVSAAGSVINGAVGGAISGATAGPVGAVAGAVGGLVSGGISAATTGLTTAIATNLARTQADLTIDLSQSKLNSNTLNNTERTQTAINAQIGQKDATNLAITTSANNTASSQKENALTMQSVNNSVATTTENMQKTINVNNFNLAETNKDATFNNVADSENGIAIKTLNTSKDNAQTSYDASIANAKNTYDNSLSKIQNDIYQSKLKEPYEYGLVANNENSTTKPQCLWTNVITQSKSAIKQAGDEFMRYGYRLDRQWDFDGNWNVGKYFTYWKLRDYWVQGNTLQDYYQDALRFFLMGGVTVWRKPEYIGAVSIYDNFN